MKAIVIEDDKAIRENIKTLLNALDIECEIFEDGSKGLIALEKQSVDLIVLDIVLPGISGYYVCSQIRKRPEIYGTPLILMLTAKNKTEDLVLGFDNGADDYLKKPYDEREFVSRIQALIRRLKGNYKSYKYKGILIDTEKLEVTENGKKVELTKKEYDVLLYFIINKGLTITREKATEDIWDIQYYEGLRTLDTYVKILKKKFADIRENLDNIRGFGYKLED